MNTQPKFLLITVILLAAGSAFAAETVFMPDADVFGLNHYRAYTWGIDLGANTQTNPLSEFVLTFKGIYNYNTAPNILYIHLLDTAPGDPVGLTVYRDRQAGGNFFDGQGVQVGTWSDDRSDEQKVSNPTDIVFEFSKISVGGGSLLDLLNQYGRDGYVAIGLDPDCHFWTEGISSTFSSPSAPIVPAPAAVVLGGIGTALVGWLRRRQTV